MTSLIHKPIRKIAALFLLVTALSGCITTIVEPETPRASTRVEYAYIKPGADFSRYTKLMSDGLEIYYPEQSTPPAPEDLERIRTAFRTAFLTALGDDYPIVTTPGRDVLRVKAQLVDIDMTTAGGLESGGQMSAIVSYGELTFLMEMIDSKSGQLLARAADRSTNSAIGDSVEGWAAVDAAAVYWAELFRNWLDRSLGANVKD